VSVAWTPGVDIPVLIPQAETSQQMIRINKHFLDKSTGTIPA
jgi:hypothetical protein